MKRDVRSKMKKKSILRPESKIKLIKLWLGASKQGYSIGQTWEVGYYSKSGGLDTIWLCDIKNRRYTWTIDNEFLNKYFEIIKESNIRNRYFPPQNSKKKWIGVNGEIIIGRKNTGKFVKT